MSVSLQTTETRYNNCLSKLYECSKSQGIKLGLYCMQKLHALLGSPLHQLSVVHVGGTNGKGSVATKIASAFQAEKKRVGLFTSPHIATFRERIQIDNNLISKEEVILLLAKIDAAAKQAKLSPSFFETTTLMAFLYFAEKKVDVAVIEVGLGGRFDATNLVVPKLAVITSIAKDHEAFLGSDLAEIAWEKGGIIKPKVPIVLGPTAAKHTLLKILAQEKKAPLIQVEGEYPDYDAENTAIAKAALKILAVSKPSIEKGLHVRPPCRFEKIEKKIPIIFDVAHNPSGMKALLIWLKKRFRDERFRFLVALSSDKAHLEIFKELVAIKAPIHLTESHRRSTNVHTLVSALQNYHCSPASIDRDVHRACQTAYSQACQHQEVLVITGTFYMMSACKEALGLTFEKDSLAVSDF